MSMANYLTPSGAEAITPSDTAYVNYVGFYVGTTGNVTVETAKGDTVAFNSLPVGAIIQVHIVRVKATGTTASNLVGFKA